MATIVDIAIHESGSGGNLSLTAEDLTTVQGVFNQVYLALFGGNIEENTTIETAAQEQRNDWWGNELVELPFNSNYERELLNNSLNSGGVSALEDAAKEDLKYIDFADVEVEGSIIGVGKFQLIVILTEPDGKSTKIKFIWDGARNELIEQRIL